MKRELFERFNEEYGGYITISEEVVESFLKNVVIKEVNEYTLDLLRDYVLSNGLEEEVVL